MSDQSSYYAYGAVRDDRDARVASVRQHARTAAKSWGAGAKPDGSRRSQPNTANVNQPAVGESPDLLSLSSAARRLGIRRRHLAQAVKAGELVGYRPGARTVRVEWTSVIRWLRSKRIAATDHARARAAEIVSEEARKETAAE